VRPVRAASRANAKGRAAVTRDGAARTACSKGVARKSARTAPEIGVLIVDPPTALPVAGIGVATGESPTAIEARQIAAAEPAGAVAQHVAAQHAAAEVVVAQPVGQAAAEPVAAETAEADGAGSTRARAICRMPGVYSSLNATTVSTRIARRTGIE
jgi:hypothetical protein